MLVEKHHPPVVSDNLSDVRTGAGSLEVAHRLWGRLWKPDLASLHRMQGPVELNCELRTAHRKRLFVKQTYMYFMAAALVLFYFGLQ